MAPIISIGVPSASRHFGDGCRGGLKDNHQLSGGATLKVVVQPAAVKKSNKKYLPMQSMIGIKCLSNAMSNKSLKKMECCNWV